MPAVPLPTSVIIAVVLTYVEGVLNVIAGITLFIVRDSAELPEDVGRGSVLALAVMLTVLGLLIAGVSIWLATGSNAARMTIAVVEVISVGTSVWSLIAVGLTGATSAIGSILITVVVLVLLFNPSANDYFAARTVDRWTA